MYPRYELWTVTLRSNFILCHPEYYYCRRTLHAGPEAKGSNPSKGTFTTFATSLICAICTAPEAGRSRVPLL